MDSQIIQIFSKDLIYNVYKPTALNATSNWDFYVAYSGVKAKWF